MGVSRYDATYYTTFDTFDGLGHTRVNSIAADRHGKLWFGTSGGGVSRYDGASFTTFSTEDGLAGNGVNAIVEDRKGHLWIGTNGGVSRYDGAVFTTFNQADGLVNNSVLAIVEDKNGALWFGTGAYGYTDELGGISFYDGDSFTTFTSWDGLGSNRVLDGIEDRYGQLWFATDAGVSRYTGASNPKEEIDGEAFVTFTTEDGLADQLVQTVEEDQNGHLWFGTWGGGISRFDGEGFVTFTTRDGLALNVVTLGTMMVDKAGHVWVGTMGGGVGRYDGQVFQTVHEGDGLPSSAVNCIFEDPKGQVWIATSKGLSRFRPHGVAPTVRIEAVVADRRYEAPEALRLSTAARVIAFEFGGVSLKTRAGALVYRYRLRGFDDHWRNTRRRRIEYPDVPVGKYTFEVEAVDRDLDYSKAPASLKLEVYPQDFAKPLHLGRIALNDFFVSFYPTYAQQPLGTVEVSNQSAEPKDIALHCNIPRLLRQPFSVERRLAPRTTEVIPIHASFDPAVLQLEGTLPLEAEIELEYSVGEEIAALKKKPEITLYGRGVLRWDSVARAAAFITSEEPSVAAFARQSLVAFADQIAAYGRPLENLTRGMVLFEALKAHGLHYLADANSPYAKASVNEAAIDHIQYPAQLLHSKSGDCDDLTVLYASLLENARVPTALVDYPGHIFLLFDSGVQVQEAFKLPLERRQYIVRGDRVWIPVEITALDQPFAKAWRQGLDQLKELSKRDRRRLIIDTDAAWEQYPPTSPVFEQPIEPPAPSRYEKAFLRQYDGLEDQIQHYIDEHYIDPLKADPHNSALRAELGQLYVALKQYDTAIKAALKYLRSKGGDTAATNNHIGLVYYYKGELDQAAYFLGQALELAPNDERIQANLAIVRAALGEIESGASGAIREAPATAGTKGAVGVEEPRFHWVE